MTIEAGVFLLLLVFLLIVFGKDLRDPRTHGFFRFFSFAFVLALVTYNARIWFDDPFSFRQIVSWILLAGSVAVVLAGGAELRSKGDPTAGIETTTRVVDSGIYRWIRHPLYLTFILVAWGSVLKRIDLAAILLAAAATLFAVLTALVEEGENVRRLGPDYAGYMKRSKRFLPFVF